MPGMRRAIRLHLFNLLLVAGNCRQALLLEDVHGERAINWAPHHVAHSAAMGCIHPAPVGNQCMLRVEDAISACVSMDGCHSLLCPDAPMAKHGSYCLARGAAYLEDPLVERHGMCHFPHHCSSLFFHPVSTRAAVGKSGAGELKDDVARQEDDVLLLVPARPSATFRFQPALLKTARVEVATTALNLSVPISSSSEGAAAARATAAFTERTSSQPAKLAWIPRRVPKPS